MPTGPTYPQHLVNPYGGSYTYSTGTDPYGYSRSSMPSQPVQQNNSNSLMTVLVNSEDEVNNYPVAAGFTVMLVDFSHNKFWLKSTAMNGVPQPPRVFTISEISQQPSQIQNESVVTREEFDSLNSKLSKLIANLGGAE